ncbi:MAG: murein L,D-transpeptidase, partial [Planktomarina sp.]|nr:murein L,D-transpeptidase [Planktomarina sp.]
MQIFRLSFISLLFISLIIVSSFVLSSATAQSISFRQAVAKTAATDPLLFKFYKANDFKSLWVGDTNIEHERFNSLIQAFLGSAAHGLPPEKFGVDVLLAKVVAVKTDGQLGNLDVELTIDFLKYARAVGFGLLVPSSVDEEIVRKVDYQDRYNLL